MSDVKTIRVVLAAHTVHVGRECASFDPRSEMDYIAPMRNEEWFWRPRDQGDQSIAIVDVPINTLEPTDDGDPDELQLCEQAQREDRP